VTARVGVLSKYPVARDPRSSAKEGALGGVVLQGREVARIRISLCRPLPGSKESR